MLFKEAEEVTILETQLPSFFEKHYTLDQVQQLLQFENVRTASRFISPFGMGLKELFYIPTDENGFERLGAPKKQLRKKLYLPKELWSQYLIEEELIQKFERKIVERFTFKLNNRMKHLAVIVEERIMLEEDEAIPEFEKHKRPKWIKVRQLNKKTKELNSKYTSTLLNMCHFISLASVDCSLTHSYYDPQHYLWLVKTGLYKTDYIVPYQVSIGNQPREERFQYYLHQAGLTSQGVELQQNGDTNIQGWMGLFQSNPEQMFPKSPIQRELIINGLLSILYKEPAEMEKISALIFQLTKKEAELM